MVIFTEDVHENPRGSCQNIGCALFIRLDRFQKLGDFIKHSTKVFPIKRRSDFFLNCSHNATAHNLGIGQTCLYAANDCPANDLRCNGLHILVGTNHNGRIVQQMVSYTKVVILDCFDGVLIKSRVGKVINNDRRTLHSTLQAFNAGTRKVRSRKLCLLTDHHFEQGFQKASFTGLTLPIYKAKDGVGQCILIIADRHITHTCHKRCAEEPVCKLIIPALHSGDIAVEFVVAIHVLEEQFHIMANILCTGI